MAHVTSKRLLLVGVFALSSAFVLASCDAVTAVPVNYENPIILKDGNVYEDDENKLGEIYDALASNKNEKVVANPGRTVNCKSMLPTLCDTKELNSLITFSVSSGVI